MHYKTTQKGFAHLGILVLFIIVLSFIYFIFKNQIAGKDFESKTILKDVVGYSLYESKNKLLYIVNKTEGLEIGNYDLEKNEKSIIKFFEGYFDEYTYQVPIYRSEDGRFFFFWTNSLFEISDNNIEEIDRKYLQNGDEQCEYLTRDAEKIENIELPNGDYHWADLFQYKIITTKGNKIVISCNVNTLKSENIKIIANSQAKYDLPLAALFGVIDGENDLEVLIKKMKASECANCKSTILFKHKGKQMEFFDEVNTLYYPSYGSIVTSKGDFVFLKLYGRDLLLLTPKSN